MDEKTVRTSWKQRIIILVIAAILLGSSVAMYIGIVLSSNSSSQASKASEAEIAELQTKYEEAYGKYQEEAVKFGQPYFDEMLGYKSRVKSYNAESANGSGLVTNDIKVGDGAEITDETSYFAYYIGWCADESIFDSSFDSNDNPTALKEPLVVQDPQSMIEGWSQGIAGMHLGGVRELSVPGELAYKDSQEICGGTYSPLKFVVMALPQDEKLQMLYTAAENAYYQLLYTQYGMNGA